MAKGDTKTNQYLDIAANGTRADLPTDTCCETRSQTLIREVAERIIDLEEEVQELEDNPDVADIVDTYADLMAYDTSTLTDRDIIRVLNDETHGGESTYYRYSKATDSWTYIGSTGQRAKQSDWDEDDSTDMAFIKNKPFYSESVDSDFEQEPTTTSGSTPDTNYVWFIEQFQDYALHEVLADFNDGDTVYATITYSVNGVERSDTGKFTLTFEGNQANLDYDAPAGSRWYGAYISEVNLGDTTVRWPVLATDSGATVYITNIEYSRVKQLDAEYIPIDGNTITINANGELQSSGGGGGTSNFNQLTNRPSYNNTTMTGSTSIPKVPIATSELTNDSGFITSSALPTVNDATLTITQNGTSKGTFTANDADDTTIALTDTTYTAGSGLDLTGTEFSVDTTTIQPKLTAGSNVTIDANNEISATDTTYSNFVGTDGTAAGAAGLVPAPATTDAGKFLKADGTWDTAGGGSGVTELTTADYNYPTDNPTSVALWLLEPGIYTRSTADGVVVRYGTGANQALVANENTVLVTEPTASGSKSYLVLASNNTVMKIVHSTSSGSEGESQGILNTGYVIQSIGTSTTSVMSQSATTGMVYRNGDRTKIQVGATSAATGSNYPTAIGSDATASGFSDSIAIGRYAKASSNGAIAIGGGETVIDTDVEALGSGSIALGTGAKATQQGQMDIGSANDTSYGYNNSNYRLLTGLYDPQSAHDAATKGYVDTAVAGAAYDPTISNNTLYL